MTSRTKKDRLRKGNLFIPLIFSFGAALEDLALDDFLNDPTKISNTMRLIQNHFQGDGAVSYADHTLLARSLGCNCRLEEYPPAVEPLAEWPADFDQRIQGLTQSVGVVAALEATRRLNVLLPDAILVGMIAGPVKLLAQLTDESGEGLLQRPERLASAGRAALTLAKAMGEAGIDILIVLDEQIPSLSDQGVKMVSRSYTPIWNTAKFYDVSPLLMIENFSLEDSIRFTSTIDCAIASIDAIPLMKRGKKLSFSLPVSVLEADPKEIETTLSATGIFNDLPSAKLFLVTTQGEIPPQIDKERMIRGVQTIRDFIAERRGVS